VHYAVKRAYAPLALQAVLDGAHAQLFVVSDLLQPTPATITLRLVSLQDSSARSCKAAAAGGGGNHSSSARAQQAAPAQQQQQQQQDAAVVGSFKYTVPGLFATRVWSMPAAELLRSRPGCSASSCYLSVTAEASGVEPSESQLWFAPFKSLALPDPRISITNVSLVSPIEVQLTVRSAAPAPLVMLSAGAERAGHFTDNGFNLDPCQPRTVTFVTHAGVFSAADMRGAHKLFTAESLFDHSSWSDAAASKAAPAAAAAAAARPAAAASAAAPAKPKNGRRL
jgi:hypothetical protein